MSPRDSPHTPPEVHVSELLLRLQIAEYEALMNRGNYFMSFYVGMTSVIVAVAAFILQEWLKSRDSAMLWLGGAAVLVTLHLWGKFVEEDYLLVSYLENNLRQEVARNASGLSAESFWQYERFLARWQVHENWWQEWVLPGCASIVFVAGLVLGRHALRQDSWWVITDAILVVSLLARTYVRLHVRKTFAHRAPIGEKTA